MNNGICNVKNIFEIVNKERNFIIYTSPSRNETYNKKF